MKHFRIISDGNKYRVQKRFRFAGFRMWQNERYYEINDTYPKVISHNIEFEDVKEAEDYVSDQLDKIEPSNPWRVIARF